MPHLMGRRAGLAQDRIDLQLPQDGVEHGFAICEDCRGNFVAGPETSGTHNSVSIDVQCPAGFKPTGLFHTHPGGSTTPSPTDIKSARRLGIRHLCIAVPDTGEMVCHDLAKKREGW